ncbi:MAG TPA: RuBisCO large subunit C-terminal-like domain-containing protein [Chloroflexota bacterium]|nr:RuBisCO large subunit C-terminal-like domain-containing protein [Chloroflexota bacterium]
MTVPLSGERFQVVYRIRGGEAEARAIARDICIEQTVEFPADLVPAGDIREQIVGRIESLEPRDDASCQASISYAVETTGGELTQLLNVIFGNYSMKPGVRVERLDLPASSRRALGGPRFGRAGLRALLDVPRRPLLCSALKPLGLPPAALADLAYQMALGGIDVVKDDHGLANQPFAPFDERVRRCADAVARANHETGLRCIYLPNVTAVGDVTVRNARFAKAAGAGGLLVSPGLAGLGSVTQLATDASIGLPILSHPAFQGSLVASPDSGIAHDVLFGQIARLAGADASIYPNYGGRFAFSRDECRAIAESAAAPMDPIKPSFPVPGGGMTVARVPELLDFYGRDVIFLIGGGLHQHGPDLVKNCRAFRRLVEGR